ncbi:MAG: serine/threonine-protein kinase, partial [Byssovorax sp.]
MAELAIRHDGRVVGRYALLGELASGGMATVHYGRLLGPVGFSRTVAIKRLHPQFAKDPEFVAMFLDEARLAARIQHPNVVSTLDVVALEGELLLVLEYVHGEALSQLLRAARRAQQAPPLRIVAAVASGILHGLHAAHEAKSERGEPLGIVHRDMSPQNVLVGADGTARVLDFGVAKAAGRVASSREGQLKGKLAYMSPEQVHTGVVDRRTDVYAASIVLWEVLAGRRLFDGDNEGLLFSQVSSGTTTRPGELVPDLPPELEAIVMRGLAREPSDRYATAWDMAVALEEAIGLASPRQVG